MLKILERRITLQLLVFYALFVLPLLLGGVELYLFQRDTMQQSAQQADLGLAQAIALQVETNVQAAAEEDNYLSQSAAARQLNLPQLISIFATAKLSYADISLYAVCDTAGKMILNYPINRKTLGQDFSGYDYFQNALHGDKPVISSQRLSPTTNTYVVSIASRIIGPKGSPVGVIILNLSLQQLTSRLLVVRQQLANSSEVRIWVVDGNGKPVADTEGVSPDTDLLRALPGLKNALGGSSGNMIAYEQNRDWLYSYVPINWLHSYIPINGTNWAVAVQRPTDVTFAVVISFQHSLIIALVMLIVGASVFWFVMHGWVVAPLSRLAQAATLIRPDQEEKVTDSKLLVRERSRSDEVGKLVNAFSRMEEEIHSLFRKTDERSQARLHTLDAIMRSIDEGVLLERPDGQIIYANHNYTQFVGIPPQEVLLDFDSFNDSHLMEKLLAMVVDPDAYVEAVRKAEESEHPQAISFQVRGYYNRDGQWLPVRRDIHMRLFEVRDLTGQLIGRGKIFNDVTRQNQAEQVKKNLLAIVSHELRTPLTAIKGYATSMLETDIELDEALQKHFLSRIVEEDDRMAELVTSLLEMSQLEAGTLKLFPAWHHLETLLEPAIAISHPCTIHTCLPDDIPLLYVDRKRMEVVFRNLLENARRYAGADAVIEISARCEQESAERGLYLDIADNGPGLPSHLTERIFDRFYQVDGGRERSSSGVGLGLAICRGFIEAHGGRIWAENRSDSARGAIFHIWLPPRVLHKPGEPRDTLKLNEAM
ncbi:MAG TPA: ATP-binding protein [Ktedonobacteraceae bacterium]|nr:ATP-binding protein [Ktedonobacteraceae bacterium]